MGALRSALLGVFVVVAVPAHPAASDEGVRRFLKVIERRETGGDCFARPPTGSAVGCYQMTRAALQDVGLKDRDGNWLPNNWGITSDAEFQRSRAANDYAMREYTALNWNRLSCTTKCTIGGVGEWVTPAALLSGAHFLGAGGMTAFVACGLREAGISPSAVRSNGGNGAKVHQMLLARMLEVLELDISELAPFSPADCPCGATP